MQLTKTPQKVIAGVIIKDNQILIGLRRKLNKWEFPGGKMEQGETHQECLIREMQEELDIICEISDYLGSSLFTHLDNHYELIFYRITSFSGTPKPLVHTEIKWVPFTSLHDYDFFEPDIKIVNLLTNF